MDMNKTLEQLTARIEKLELELKKEKAVTEIQNLLGRYVYMHIGGQHEGCMSLFSKREDMTVEIGPMGLFRGPKGLEQIYGVNHTVNEGDRIGFLAVHPLTTPVIEVADDLQTAKGLWLHHGVETQPDIPRWSRLIGSCLSEASAWKDSTACRRGRTRRQAICANIPLTGLRPSGRSRRSRMRALKGRAPWSARRRMT